MRHIFFVFSFVIFSSSAFALPNTVMQSPSLLALFRVISEIADQGPMMSYFGYSEVPGEISGENCGVVPIDQVDGYINNLVKEMDWATQSQKKIISENLVPGLSDLRIILGSTSIERCDGEQSDYMTWTRIVRFRNKTSGYQITFTEGYED